MSDFGKLVVGFLSIVYTSSGCLGTITHQKNQQFHITSQPAGVGVSLNGNPLGITPLDINHPYQEQTYNFNRWWWLSVAVSTGLSVGGLVIRNEVDASNSDSASLFGTSLLSLGLASLAYSVYYCILGESRHGEFVKKAKKTVNLEAKLDGYSTLRRKVLLTGSSDNVFFQLKSRKNYYANSTKREPTDANSHTIVAVFDIQDKREKSRLRAKTLDQLSDYLSAKFSQETGYRIVPRKQLRSELLAQKKASYRQCFDSACQIEIGKAVSASSTLVTKIIQIGRSCAVSGILFDLKSETAEKAATAKASSCTPDGIMQALDQMVGKLRS
jgi:hypothetical protein